VEVWKVKKGEVLGFLEVEVYVGEEGVCEGS
jgi:hypothetical protein